MRNVLRSIQSDNMTLNPDEIRALFVFAKNEQLQRDQISLPESRPDSSAPYYELYKVDLECFKNLFTYVSPWGSGPEMGNVLAERTFRYILFFYLITFCTCV